MAVCKVCGGFINDNENCCSFCGTTIERKIIQPANKNQNVNNIDNSNIDFSFNIFNDADWEIKWKNSIEENSGIILTDTSNVRKKDKFFSNLKQYIEFRLHDGISYYLLDLYDQKVLNIETKEIENIIPILKKIYAIHSPNFLLIIGDDKVIPKMIWDNESGDDDEVVPSDFIYMILDFDSPWSGKEYDLEKLAPVGRIPTSSFFNFEESITYMQNTIKQSSVNIINGFAYSALEWEKTSINVFEDLSTNIYYSPDFVAIKRGDRFKELPSLTGYNLFGINLHGSSTTNYYYGQKNSLFPEAFYMGNLPNDFSPFVFMTEACYGAKSLFNYDNESSILLNALQRGCVGFVGSSMVAYGSVDGGLCCADIIANTFIAAIKNELNLGDSFKASLMILMEDDLDECGIKTFVEFALYGDPSIVFYKPNTAKKVAYTKKEIKYTKPRDNINRARKLIPFNEKVGYYGKGNHDFVTVGFEESDINEIKKVAYEIKGITNEFVKTNYNEYSNVEPVMYKVFGADEYRSVYKIKEKDFDKVISIHLDNNGKVKKIYESK